MSDAAKHAFLFPQPTPRSQYFRMSTAEKDADMKKYWQAAFNDPSFESCEKADAVQAVLQYAKWNPARHDVKLMIEEPDATFDSILKRDTEMVASAGKHVLEEADSRIAYYQSLVTRAKGEKDTLQTLVNTASDDMDKSKFALCEVGKGKVLKWDGKKLVKYTDLSKSKACEDFVKGSGIRRRLAVLHDARVGNEVNIAEEANVVREKQRKRAQRQKKM